MLAEAEEAGTLTCRRYPFRQPTVGPFGTALVPFVPPPTPPLPPATPSPFVTCDAVGKWGVHRCARVHGGAGGIGGLAECCGADTPLGSHVRSELALRATTTTRAYRTFRLERGVDVLSRVSMTPGSPRCP